MSFLNQLFGGDFANRAARAGALVNGDYAGAMELRQRQQQQQQQQMNVATGLDERQRGVLESLGNLIRGHPAGMGGKLPMGLPQPQQLPQLPGQDFLSQFANRPNF